MDEHVEKAAYRPSRVPEFAGNPLIEAFPAWPDDEISASKRLLQKPLLREEEKQYSASDRIDIIESRLWHWMYPTSDHLRSRSLIEAQIFRGYKERNPLTPSYQAVLHGTDGWRRSPGSIRAAVRRRPAAAAFVTGILGMGKTELVKRVLGTFGKEVKQHANYAGRTFAESQIVWLLVTIPLMHSWKALCMDILYEMAGMLGNEEYARIAMSNITADKMTLHIRSILLSHHVGLLVLDDVQNLSAAASGGEKGLLTNFLRWREDLGVPMLLIGTYKAANRLGKDWSVARRFIEGGFHHLARPESSKDVEWRRFVKKMWKYQWLRESSDSNPDEGIIQALYDYSQGVTGWTLQLFVNAQKEAIFSKKERIDADHLKRVYAKTMFHLHPMIEAFRTGTYKNNEELCLGEEFKQLAVGPGPVVKDLERALQLAESEKEDL